MTKESALAHVPAKDFDPGPWQARARDVASAVSGAAPEPIPVRRVSAPDRQPPTSPELGACQFRLPSPPSHPPL